MKKITLLLIFVILLSSLVSAWQYVSIDGTDKIEANDYVCLSGTCAIEFNFTNQNLTDTKKWQVPIYSDLEGVEFYIWAPNGYYTFTPINISDNQTNYTRVDIYDWKPKNIVSNTPSTPYKWKANASTTVNIGKNETKAFRMIFKNLLGKIHKIDIDTLDPLITSTEYKIGNATYPWPDEVNTTISNGKVNSIGGAGNQYGNITLGQETDVNATIIDNFDRVDNTALGNSWTETTSDATDSAEIKDNQLKFTRTTDIQGMAQKEIGNFNIFNITVDLDYNQSAILFGFGMGMNSNSTLAMKDGGGGLYMSWRNDGGQQQYLLARDGVTLNSTIGAGLVNASTNVIRFFYDGTELRVRMWTKIQDEPSDWQLTAKATNTNYGNVTLGFHGSANALGTLKFDNLLSNFSTPQTNFLTLNNTVRINQISLASGEGKFLNFTVNATHTIISNATNDFIPQYNISCDSGVTWTSNVSLLTEVKCSALGDKLVYEVLSYGSNDTTELSTATLAVNISFNLNTLPQISLTTINDTTFNSSNATIRFTLSDTQSHGSNITLNYSSTENNINLFGNESNNSNGAINLQLQNLKDDTNYYWQVIANDNVGDVNNVSASGNFTIDSVQPENATRFEQLIPSATLQPNGQLSIQFAYWVGFNSTSAILENNQTINKSVVDLNISSLNAYNRTNNFAVVSLDAVDDISIRQSGNITANECNLFTMNFTVVNAINASSIISSDDTNNKKVRVEYTIENKNLTPFRINDIDLFIDIADLPQWTSRTTIDSVSWSLESGSGGGTYQNVTLNSNCGEVENTITQDATTGNNTIGSGQYTADATGFTVSNLDVGGSTYRLRLTYSYQGVSESPGGGGGGGGATEQSIIGAITSQIGNATILLTTEFGRTAFDQILVPPGGARERIFTVENKGVESANIILECEELTIGICKYIKYSLTQLSLKQNERIAVGLNVNLPENIKEGTYGFNVLAKVTAEKGALGEIRLGANNVVTSSIVGRFFSFFQNLKDEKTFNLAGKEFTVSNVWIVILSTFIFMLITGVILKLALAVTPTPLALVILLVGVISFVTIGIFL